MHNAICLLLTLFVFPLALLSAQQTKVVPDGMDFVEGTNFFTYPFGRADGAIQILYDAERITTPGNVVVMNAMRFRSDGGNGFVGGFSKSYRVTAYQVTTTAAAMVADPVTNIGTAVGSVLFDGLLTLPAIGPYAVAPAPFDIVIPFAVQNPPNPPSPFVYDSAQGNLLLLIEATDSAPASSSYRVDAVVISDSRAEGLATDIDSTGCTNASGASLSVSVNGAAAIPGGIANVSTTSSRTGAFQNAFVTFGFRLTGIDLGVVGIPGCSLYSEVAVAVPIAENPGGGYPSVGVGIPAVASIEGTAIVVQAVGAGTTSLAETVASNSIGLRVGAIAPPVRRAMMATRFGPPGSRWGMGSAGEFVPVVQFDGTF